MTSLPSSLRNLHWLAAEPEPVVGETGALPERADVVVIGGGYAGGATAYWLARFGAGVVLVERRGISTGATGRNAGFIAPGLGMSFRGAVERYGTAGALDRLAFTRAGRDLALAMIRELEIDCALEAQGGLTVAVTDEEWTGLRASGEALVAAGTPFQLLTRDELAPHLHVPVPEVFRGALYNPETLLVNPALLNDGIIRAALRLGARTFTGTEVFAVTDQPNGRLLVETSRGTVEAGHAVLATNAWSPLLAGFFTGRIVPVRGQVLATEPAPPVFKRAMSANEGYEYWSQRAEGTIVLGGARWAVTDRDEGYYAEEVNPDVQDALEVFLRNTFPALRDVGVARRWAGIMGFSSDGYPFIGPMPGRPRLLVAAGFTGHGGPYFAIAGRSLAALITSGRSEVPLDAYGLDRAL